MSNSESSQRISPIAWLYLVAFCVASSFVFVLVQGSVASLIVPTLSALGVASAIGVRVGFVGMSILGALLAAAVLCIPLGWLARERAPLFGTVVGLVGGATILWIWQSLPPDGLIFWSSRIPELVAFIGGCILFAVVGARGPRRVAA
jgi:hypothetical protein